MLMPDFPSEKSTRFKRQAPSLSLGLALFVSVCLLPLTSKAESPETKPNIINENGLSNAAESLSKILADAKRQGFMQAKPTVVETQTAEPVESPLLSCAAAEVLDFQALQPIEAYEDLITGKDVSSEMEAQYGALHLARIYLSLGLGVEAVATLSPYEGADAELLKRVAMLLADPHYDVETPLLEIYADCNSHAELWAILENPERLETVLSGERRRRIVNTMPTFPKYIRENLSVNLAIKAAENDNMFLAQAIWAKMDTEARETGHRLPADKTEKDDYLYLNGLLKKDSDPNFYLSVLNYLAEREGVFRLTALTQLSKLNRTSTAKINASLEDDLLEVSQNFSNGYESQLAAMELVKNRIHIGRAVDAISATKKYFSPSDAEYRQSVLQITDLVQGRLRSEHQLNRIVGLNDYLYDTRFFEYAGNTDGLRYDALSAALLSGLPELHHKIFDADESLPTEAEKLMQQARFFADLKIDSQQVLTQNNNNMLLPDILLKRVARHALANNNTVLARSMAAKLSGSEARQNMTHNIAWIEGRWADTAGTDDKITDVLKQSAPIPLTTSERNWIKKLPKQLLDIETTLQKTQAYLKNG